MKTYSINYNLGNPRRDYTTLINKIKNLANGWCHVGGSHWFINSDLGTARIRDELGKVLDSDDELLVHTVGDDWQSWNLSEEKANWLLTHWRSACRV